VEQEIKVYTLKRPVKAGELSRAEVKLCRPVFKDFMAVGNQSIETAAGVVSLIASVSGLPEAVVRLFDVEDCAVMRIEAARMAESYFLGTGYSPNPTEPPATEAGTAAATETEAAAATEAETAATETETAGNG
jgi:hypothetical protein